MFAKFNYDNFPIVHVYFSTNINNDSDFINFLNQWLELYESKKKFSFIFHTENVGYIPIKYAISMSLFIKKLKKKEIQYLQKSIIIINSSFVKNMLELIFYLQSPVAPVILLNKKKIINLENKIKYILSINDDLENKNNTVIILPNSR